MKISKDFMSNQNSYEGNQPKYIVIHNTDNFNKTADANAHAKAQHDGNISGMSAHYYVDDGAAYQAMPHDRGAWHVGVNYGGKLFGTVNNRNSIGIEMCVNAGYDYEMALLNTVVVTQQVMKELNIDAAHVVSHYDVCGKNCPSQIRAKGDWTRFKKLIGAETDELPGASGDIVVDKLYRVRKSWEDSASQIGAYKDLNNAKSVCGIGYKVYDWNGKVVYENDQEVTGTQTVEFANLSEPDAAAKLLEISRPIAEKHNLLPSVCAAQTILESGYGYGTELAKIANNVCGMKATLSGNTWPGSVWDGSSTVRIKTPEQDAAGNTYYIYADFRKYPNMETSIEDRCAYLLGAMNGSKKRYEGIQNCKDYRDQITLIKVGGYATDTKYVDNICNIIQRFDLNKYDVAGEGSSPEQAPAVMKYFVRKSWTDKKSQLDAYTDLNNAKKRVDGSWQYNVYDAAGKELYNGVAALNDRIINTAVGIANDNSHGYNNSGKGWGPEYNCIGLVMQSCNMSGINVGKCTIQKMPDYLIKAGYEDVTADINFKNGKGLKKGDILWMLDKTGKHGHTELAVGDGRLVGARGDMDGRTGDSSGNEIAVSAYYNYSWQRVFRLPGADKSQGNENDNIFRVQAGAYKDKTKAIKAQKRVRNAGYPDAFIRNEDGMYKIQAGAFAEKKNAEKRVADLKAAGFDAFIQGEKALYLVQAGLFEKRENANNLVKKLNTAGFDALVNEVNGQYQVQTGVFEIRSNADKMVSQLKSAGFNAIIK